MKTHRKSFKKNKEKEKEKVEKDIQVMKLSETEYMDIIIINNIDINYKFIPFSLENLFKNITKEEFNKLFINLDFISGNILKYKSLVGKNYLGVFIYPLLYLLEDNEQILYNKKRIFLERYLNLIKKFYDNKKLSNNDIIIILKFLVFSSIYKRNEINSENVVLLTNLINTQIKYYSVFKYSIDIVKCIDEPKITVEFCNFLEKNFLTKKTNVFKIINNIDIIELLYLKDDNDIVFKLISNLYAFHYSKNILNLFMEKIKEVYNIKNKNMNSINALHYLNKNILFLNNLIRIEDTQYEQDSFKLSNGFVCNNNRFNGFKVTNIILQTSFTMIFSFCFNPEGGGEKKNKKKGLEEYPIINLISENDKLSNDGLSFYIQDCNLIHKDFNGCKHIKICEIEKNQTYIVYYTIKEHDKYIIHIRSENMNKVLKDTFPKNLKKNLLLQVAKFNHHNFEGYIGPILLFKTSFEDNFPAYIFTLKGMYEKSLYFHDFVLTQTDKYDRFMNCLTGDITNSKENFLISKAKFKERLDYNKNLLAYITPVYEGSSLDKLIYINNTFVETKVVYYKEPKIENNATFFFKHNYTPFEFLRYEGMYYLIYNIELITSNTDNIESQSDKEQLLNIFTNIINFSMDLISLLNVELYVDEQKKFIFAVEKCVAKICSKLKMVDELSNILNKWLINLTSQNPDFSKTKLIYYNNMRNEVAKFLLNKELYESKNYSGIEYFLCSLDDSLQKNSNGLITIENYNKIMSFSEFYDDIINPRIDTLKHDKEYKALKETFNSLIIHFLKLSDINSNINFLQTFLGEYKINYKKYNFIKIFYLISEIYYNNAEDKSLLGTWKYFVDLYIYLENNDTYIDITKKESQKIMGLCLGFLFDYPICDDFFKLYKFKKKKLNSESVNKNIKFTNDSPIVKPNSEFFSSIKEEKGKNTNSPKINPTPLSKQTKKSMHRKLMSTDIRLPMKSSIFFNDNILNEEMNNCQNVQDFLYGDNNKTQNKIRNDSPIMLLNSNEGNKDYRSNSTYKMQDSKKNIKSSSSSRNDSPTVMNNNNNYRSASITNYNRNNNNNKITSNIPNLNKINVEEEEIGSKSSGKLINMSSHKSFKDIEKNKNEIIKINKIKELKIQKNENNYEEFYSYPSLFPKLCKSLKFNEYCFKTLFLFIMEKNGEGQTEKKFDRKTKLKFILKAKNFEDFCKKEYLLFFRLNYYNKETKEQFTSLINLIELNVKNIGPVPFYILLNLIKTVCIFREKNKCVFNHFIQSRKICSRIFDLAFLYDKEASNAILREFPDLIKLIMPYHKNPFLLDFLYNTISNADFRYYGQVLINSMLVLNFEKEAESNTFYHFKVNIIVLLYRVIKNPAIQEENFIFNEQGVNSLFNDELVQCKFNILKDIIWINNKKNKCYAELLFDVMISLCVKTNDLKYHNITYQMFVMYISRFKHINSGTKTIIYYIDKISQSNNKKSPVLKYFPKYENINAPSLCVKFLLKCLKVISKCKEGQMKVMLYSLAEAFYNDSMIVFNEERTHRAKFKGKIMYNFVRDLIEENYNKKKKDTIESIEKKFNERYQRYLLNPVEEPVKSTNKSIFSFKNVINNIGGAIGLSDNESNNTNNKNENEINNVETNNNNSKLDDSFDSCDSTKSEKANCNINQKKKFKDKKKKDKKLTTLIENLIGIEELIDFNEEENSNQSSTIEKTPDREHTTSSIGNISVVKDKINESNTSTIQINPFNLDNIDSMDSVILFPKLNLIEQTFGIYFTDRLFYNEPFIKMRQYYKYRIHKNENIEIDIDNYFNYPIIMKNYISKNLYFGGLFLKHDLNFFSNRYFHISHPYFINKAKESKQKRFFKKVSEQDDITKFIVDMKDSTNSIFYVDLITNRNVIFGELIVCKNIIYFFNINKEKFLKSKTDTERAKWLLCSQDCDYSNRNKKLYIFKREITEIINRRFLYSFQACEFYLKNGKSYYFNFYSEQKKIEFFGLFSDNPFNIKIINDLKSEFKKNDFTKLWLNGKISTLAYLLYINKYSCRSYNDINQYPVFPWMKIYDDKPRDLRYTIVAQTEDKRMMLKEKYSMSDEHFPYHYTTHYSNSSFLTYYLVRINPFTDNQITLQVNKFDAPGRQFNSIDELQKILNSTSQPREVVPEFFITTDFFYNYNCCQFGLRSNGTIVHNLENKIGYRTPLEYILSNAVDLESQECKSQINYFFDNIFGVGQMGGQDKCNTYGKYSYQEMIDLTRKISTFLERGMTLKEIKAKIDSKSNKIISFGQTPFKLLEDKHPQWQPEKNENKEIFENLNINNLNTKIIFMNIGTNLQGKQVLYCLSEKNKNNYEVRMLNLKLKEDQTKTLSILKKIKFFSKLHLFESKFFLNYKYNPKFALIEYNLSLFIFCRLTDNSFTFITNKGEYKSFLTESLITAIIKTKDKFFITGHLNGKILEWKIQNLPYINFKELNLFINTAEENVVLSRSLIAHKNKISGIYYSELLGLLITTGDDEKIIIRKYYDFSMLSIIEIKNQLCIDIKIRHNYLYTLFFAKKLKKHIVQIFSVNGLVVSQGEYNYINGIEFDQEGNLLVGFERQNLVKIYNPSLTKLTGEINVKLTDLVTEYKNKKKGKPITDIDTKEDYLFTGFISKEDDNIIFCSYSNGTIIQTTIYPEAKEKE